jgi:hypothetical protein
LSIFRAKISDALSRHNGLTGVDLVKITHLGSVFLPILIRTTEVQQAPTEQSFVHNLHLTVHPDTYLSTCLPAVGTPFSSRQVEHFISKS